MAPYATLLVLIGIAGLFWLDRRDGGNRLSMASLVPFTWLLIAMSRPVTSWMSSPASVASRAESYMEGSPIDRAILMALLAVATVTLWRRREAAAAILRRNWPIILFLLYCFISISWAEFPFVSFKRWIRAVGDVLMILVILTDKDPEASLKSIITRIGYLLVPLSILFIRFYPELGRAYSAGGRPMWTGVCTDKNALGALCMIVGAVVLWRLLDLLASRGRAHRAAMMTALTAVALMVFYLLPLVDSKTAQMCFVFATIVVLFRGLFRRPWAMFSFTAATIAACYAVLILGAGGDALEAIGRESTLTGRTDVWDQVLRQMHDPPAGVAPLSPWFGAGYENFWVGGRVVRMRGWGGNQAHNGYLEIYANLGWVGLMFLGIVIAAGFRSLIAYRRVNPDLSRLKLAFFVICLTYNFSEAAFKMFTPVWLMFLWATMATPLVQPAVARAAARSSQFVVRRLAPARRVTATRSVPRRGHGPDTELPVRR
jgi:O-antigen ligase